MEWESKMPDTRNMTEMHPCHWLHLLRVRLKGGRKELLDYPES